ncbi:outer membrane protein assembly factor BamD [Candidatus Pelagibacter sp.]|nr:outer membrane protein assembly factor BamD [Candidatus Pelagibacter sp.]
MNYKKFFFTLFLISTLILSCSKKEKVTILKEQNLESQMIELYQEGYNEFLNGDTRYAAKKFNEAELIFPQSEWAPAAALMTAYVYYSDDYYPDAIYELERYLKVYPNHEDKVYAHFLLAMCYYENIVDEKRDLAPLLKSKKEFNIVIDFYPETEFATDAGYKIELINDRLAGKEMYIARHYLKSKKWIPAINRFKNVIENYGTTIYVEEAIHRLVETHYIIGLETEAKKYAALLGYNYQSSDWYKATYKIFNKEYDFSIKKFEKTKASDKKSLFKRFVRKFKKIFE